MNSFWQKTVNLSYLSLLSTFAPNTAKSREQVENLGMNIDRAKFANIVLVFDMQIVEYVAR